MKRAFSKHRLTPYILLLMVVLFQFVIVFSSSLKVGATSHQLDVFESGSPYFNVKVAGPGCGTGADGSPGSLNGSANAEKVWNYFKSRGLSDVAAAGAMGNMEQEDSTFDPWLGESGSASIDKGLLLVGIGIIQWTNTGGDHQGRRYGVMKYLEDNGVRLDATDTSQNDKALILELNWLWDGEYGRQTWQDAVNSETTVDGDPSIPFVSDNTGNGSAMVFHKLVERSGDGTAGKQERIDSAKKFLSKFGGVGGTGGTGSSGCGGTGGVVSGSIAEVAKQMGTWGSTEPKACYVWGGGHAWSQSEMDTAIQNHFSGSYGVDCSGFVSAVIYKATGTFKTWDTSAMCNDTANFQTVTDPQPGDIAISCGEHVEVITSVDPYATVGSHHTGCGDGSGPSPAATGYRGTKVLRYIGSSAPDSGAAKPV